MATFYINYYKQPRYNISVGQKPDVVGEFISGEKLTSAGASVVTANVIPDGTGLISIYGDADFAMIFGPAPVASDTDTSERLGANILHFKEWNPISAPTTDKIAVITI